MFSNCLLWDVFSSETFSISLGREVWLLAKETRGHFVCTVNDSQSLVKVARHDRYQSIHNGSRKARVICLSLIQRKKVESGVVYIRLSLR